MAKMSCGKIYVEWYPGEKVEIATVDIDTKGIGVAEIRTRVKKFVFGMAFIRMGLRIMRHGWKVEDSGQDR